MYPPRHSVQTHPSDIPTFSFCDIEEFLPASLFHARTPPPPPTNTAQTSFCLLSPSASQENRNHGPRNIHLFSFVPPQITPSRQDACACVRLFFAKQAVHANHHHHPNICGFNKCDNIRLAPKEKWLTCHQDIAPFRLEYLFWRFCCVEKSSASMVMYVM